LPRSGCAGPVAQLDRASPSEGEGRTFESCRVRQPPHAATRASGRRADRPGRGHMPGGGHLVSRPPHPAAKHNSVAPGSARGSGCPPSGSPQANDAGHRHRLSLPERTAGKRMGQVAIARTRTPSIKGDGDVFGAQRNPSVARPHNRHAARNGSGGGSGGTGIGGGGSWIGAGSSGSGTTGGPPGGTGGSDRM
jgi:hypothetical protein